MVAETDDERLIREGEEAAKRYLKAMQGIKSMTDITDNVISMPTPKHTLVARLRAAHERMEKGRQEWVEGMADEAITLAEAREQFPKSGVGNTAFSVWLAENNLNYWGDNDRAAMIQLGELIRDDLLFVFDRVADDRWHPVTIWRMMKQKGMEFVTRRFDELSRSTESNVGHQVQINPESAPNPVATEPEQPVPPTASPKTEVQIEPINRRHPFYGLERAEEVAAFYRHGKARSLIGAAIEKRKGIWALILQVIDEGLLVPTDTVPKHPNLGILFPDAPLRFRQKYDLTKKPDFQAVSTEIMPAVLANREAIAAAPERIEEIIRSHAQRLHADAEAARQAQRIEAAKAMLKANETEVFMFGRRLWPIIDLAHPDLAYNYEELRHAVWTFRELHTATRLSSDGSPKSCGVRIRHVIKFLNGYINARVMHLLVDMSRALQKDPEGKEQLPEMPNLDRSYE